MSHRNFLKAVLLVCAAMFSASAAAEPDISRPVLLVAKPKLSGSAWAATILLVKPLPDGSHIGLILNKPTEMTLAEAFPEDAPSQKVVDPLFLGGPLDLNVVFALVERHAAVADGTIQMAPGLFLASDQKAVDHIIATEADHARFFLGFAIWRPGQLDQELERDLWFVDEPDPRLVLSKNPEKLWEELVRRSEAKARII
jgi:putative transcriptional regulator